MRTRFSSNVSSETYFLSMGWTYDFLPDPIIAPDIGEPFDHVPNAPGVIALLDAKGHALAIEACDKSMRKRLFDHYRGFEGALTVGAARIAVEACENREERVRQLIDEHREAFGFVPMRNRA